MEVFDEYLARIDNLQHRVRTEEVLGWDGGGTEIKDANVSEIKMAECYKLCFLKPRLSKQTNCFKDFISFQSGKAY